MRVPAYGRMTLAEWLEVVGGFAYKPGVKLSVERSQSRHVDMLVLMVRMAVADAEGCEKGQIDVMLAEAISPCISTVDEAVNFVRCAIVRAEMHEVDEWLRFRGVRVREPHPEN